MQAFRLYPPMQLSVANVRSIDCFVSEAEQFSVPRKTVSCQLPVAMLQYCEATEYLGMLAS